MAADDTSDLAASFLAHHDDSHCLTAHEYGSVSMSCQGQPGQHDCQMGSRDEGGPGYTYHHVQLSGSNRVWRVWVGTAAAFDGGLWAGVETISMTISEVRGSDGRGRWRRPRRCQASKTP
jgi:hypothetical protein